MIRCHAPPHPPYPRRRRIRLRQRGRHSTDSQHIHPRVARQRDSARLALESQLNRCALVSGNHPGFVGVYRSLSGVRRSMAVYIHLDACGRRKPAALAVRFQGALLRYKPGVTACDCTLKRTHEGELAGAAPANIGKKRRRWSRGRPSRGREQARACSHLLTSHRGQLGAESRIEEGEIDQVRDGQVMSTANAAAPSRRSKEVLIYPRRRGSATGGEEEARSAALRP